MRRALFASAGAWLGGVVFGAALNTYTTTSAISSAGVVLFVAASIASPRRWKIMLAGAVLMALAACITAWQIVGINLDSGATYVSPMVWVELLLAVVMAVSAYVSRGRQSAQRVAPG